MPPRAAVATQLQQRKGREAYMACEHESCRCDEAPVEQSGKSFCSEGCAESDGNSERTTRCSCGHPECAAL